MGFRAYKIDDFEFPQERIFFRAICKQLNEQFKDKEQDYVLIGNISISGNNLDALFISSNKIIVIDFKDYSGRLKFSEINPWTIVTQNQDFIYVKGGASKRNPYQQVQAYRFGLIDFLNSKTEMFLEKNNTINLGHINTMVLFHNRVEYDENEIPEKKRFNFFIADNTNYLEFLEDIASPQIHMSNKEIDKLLSTLNVIESNLFDYNIAISESEDTLPVISENKIRVAKEILNSFSQTEHKELDYFRVLLNVERKKTPQNDSKYPYHYSFLEEIDEITFKLDSNELFISEYINDGTTNFPKNIFVAIEISFNNELYPFLYTIIERSDIVNYEISLKGKDFIFYPNPLEVREFPNELIDELSDLILEAQSLEEKISILKNKLFEDVHISEFLKIALSQDSAFTSQLKSELNSLSKLDKFTNPIFNSFLKQEKIEFNNIKAVDCVPLQITKLNNSQKRAVELAISQPLTVITGPPGTGKTQVVLNILANALINDKSVLVASKNNKAVDNVNDKISSLLGSDDYFIRYGSKSFLKENTLPKLDSIITRAHHSTIKAESFDKLNKQYQLVNDDYKNYIKTVNEFQRLSAELILKDDEIVLLSKKIEESRDENLDNISLNSKAVEKTIFEVDENLLQVEKASSNTFFFNLLNKSSVFKKFNSFKSTLYSEYIDYLNTNLNVDVKTKADYINYYHFLKTKLTDLQVYKSKIENLLSDITIKKKNYKDLESKLNELKNAVEDYELNKSSYNESQIAEISLSLFREKMKHKIISNPVNNILKFKEYLPDNIPWRDDEKVIFTRDAQNYLKSLPLNSITSLSIKSTYPLSSQLFDIVIIDEASQCDLISALPLIYRAKQLVILGDPLQLKHITSVKKEEEEYVANQLNIPTKNKNRYSENSLFDFANNVSVYSGLKSVLLDEHYRCHPDIIRYSTDNFYKVKYGQDLVIHTSDTQFDFEPKGLLWINSNGVMNQNSNVNEMEINNIIIRLKEVKEFYPHKTIGITTPFKNQKDELIKRIPLELQENVLIDTVHRFQGDEKDIMFLSLVVSGDEAYRKANWINNSVPYLINVAVTRAKNTLFVVGNRNYISSLGDVSPLKKLLEYSKKYS